MDSTEAASENGRHGLRQTTIVIIELYHDPNLEIVTSRDIYNKLNNVKFTKI